MRKILTALVLTAIVGASSIGSAHEGARECADHGGYTEATGWKIGTGQDLGRDGIDACSDDDDGVDGVVRAGAGGGSAYVAADLEGDNDDYVYVTTGDNQGVYCGEGRYDEPAGYDKELDAPETRDVKRTDSCT